MKAIMMSIKPEYVAKILNGEKTLEIRKKFPSDYVGWVYIYCTKSVKKDWHLLEMIDFNNNAKTFYAYLKYKSQGETFHSYCLEGKVVARFWCDGVEEIKWHKDTAIDLDYYKVVNVIENEEILKASCLQLKELEDYLQIKNAKGVPLDWGITFNLGKAIYTTKLEIFDESKEISEFYKLGAWKVYEEQLDSSYMKRTEQEIMKSLGQTLTRAPQSWCYMEV